MGRFIILGTVGSGWRWGMPAEESVLLARKYIADMIKALTTPLTAEEANPKQAAKKDYSPIKVTADSHWEAVGEVQRIFGENRWTDGLGIVPPTREAVDWMLTGTSRAPDEYLATFEPRMGKMTVEKVAINAVMAGATPEYLPVLIAGVEAMGGYPAHRMIHYTTHSFGAAVIASGPITEEIGMNGGHYYLSIQNRANNTIGRAMNLCRINGGHSVHGMNHVSGKRIGQYDGICFAELYSGSPWSAFHVVQGLKQEDSAVTVVQMSGVPTRVTGKSTEAKLNRILKMLKQKRGGIFTLPGTLPQPGAIGTHHFGGCWIAVDPEAAQDLYDMGFTSQQKIQQYFWENCLVPYEELTDKEKKGIQARIEYTKKGEGWMLMSDVIPDDYLQMWEDNLRPGGKIPFLFAPESIQILVCGEEDTERHEPNKPYVAYWGKMKQVYGWTQSQTKKIHGATLTSAGR